ncbi:MAG: hypothetical protein P1V20_17660 [Verrucomicrobiales bacterium]|nr:hypothetical protein [Verrucomicrobiales bacterium]
MAKKNRATQSCRKGILTFWKNTASIVMIAQASGTLDPFLQNSLPEEIKTTRKLAAEITNLCDQISPKHKLATQRIREIENTFDRTLEIFEPMGKIATRESLDATVTYIE